MALSFSLKLLSQLVKFVNGSYSQERGVLTSSFQKIKSIYEKKIEDASLLIECPIQTISIIFIKNGMVWFHNNLSILITSSLNYINRKNNIGRILT